MVLINPLQWPLEGMGPEDLDFFGSQNGNEQSIAIWVQKIEILKNKGPKILSKITK
jgi:hypothetical protein